MHTRPGPGLGTCHLPGYDVIKGRMKLRPQQSRDKIGQKRILIQVIVGSLPGQVETASLSF